MNLRLNLLSVIFFFSFFSSLSAADYYVKVAGNGDGTSWESAMSFQNFVVLLPTVPDNTTFHVAEGTYYIDSISGGLVAKSNVNLIGGYTSSPSAGDVSQPDKYKAVLDASNLPDNEKRSPILFSEFKVSIVVKGFVLQNNHSHAAIKLMEVYSLDVANCIFDNNGLKYEMGSCISAFGICHLKVNTSVFKNAKFVSALNVYSYNIFTEPTTVDITNSLFDNNTSVNEGAALYFSDGSANKGSVIVDNCTFRNNRIEGDLNSSVHRGSAIFTDRQKIKISNSTFIDNYNQTGEGTAIAIDEESKAQIINNTIIGNGNNTTDCLIVIYDADVSLVGNIIADENDHLSICYSNDNQSTVRYKNNIFTTLTNNNCYEQWYNVLKKEDVGTNNIFIASSQLSSFLDGTYSNGVFTPNIKDNGGLTPTVALTGTFLPGCKSIKMVPTAETDVTTDQRGVERAELACVGAYENTDATEQCVDTDIVENVKDAQSVVIYPNPTHDLLYWQNLSVSNTHFLLYSINGTLLLETDSNPVDLSLFDSGLYLIRIGDKNYKIIKQ